MIKCRMLHAFKCDSPFCENELIIENTCFETPPYQKATEHGFGFFLKTNDDGDYIYCLCKSCKNAYDEGSNPYKGGNQKE